jgi:hypothetical protein
VADLNSLSMIFSNSATGWAPFRKIPLMKNLGVEDIPALFPSS